MRLLIALVGFFALADCEACYVTPKEQLVTGAQLLARSKDVSLAQVVRAEVLPGGGVRYFFKVERRFKGPNVTSFSLDGEASIWDGSTNTFNHHNDERFDRPNFGRVANGTDCEIHPNFSVGGHYLIFRDLPRTRKSFELIIRTHGTRDDKDKWLQRVESYFGA